MPFQKPGNFPGPIQPPVPSDFPLSSEEMDSTVLTTDQQTDEQLNSEVMRTSFFKGLVANGLLVIVVIIIGVVAILGFFYRTSLSAKRNLDSPPTSPRKSSSHPVHSSWESAIDSNHNRRLHERPFPMQVLATVHNWFNRKKVRFHARRDRRNRLPNQPKSRAMYYYKNSRAATLVASGGSANSGVANWPVGSPPSRASNSPMDSDAITTLLNAHPNQRIPATISLVSNPNYLSEAEQHLMENSGKATDRKDNGAFHFTLSFPPL